MPNVSSRSPGVTWLDAEAARRALARLARRLRRRCPEVLEVRLFGSLAHGTPTPASDADVALVVRGPLDPRTRRDLAARYLAELAGSPLPVDVVVLTPEELAAGRGVARPARDGALRLA